MRAKGAELVAREGPFRDEKGPAGGQKSPDRRIQMIGFLAAL